MKKLIKDGKVAVLVSHGFGAGWSTWEIGENKEKMVFDPQIARAILKKDWKLAKEIADKKYPEVYKGGLGDIVVEWVPVGSQFVIREYDGAETLEVIGPSYGYIA